MRRLLMLTLLTPLATPLVLTAAHAVAPAPADAPRCHGRVATVVGTHTADFLTGTPGRDVIVGRGGGDVIDGRGGDDLVCAGPGADRVSGGPGNDRLFGEADRLAGLPGGRYLDGDTLDGGRGDDFLSVGYDDRRPHVGPDAVSYAHSARGVTVDLSGRRGRATGAGHDTITVTPEMGVVGSAYDDRITGSAGRDQVVGNAGDDVIVTLGDRDRVAAEAVSPLPGDDTIDTGAGADVVFSLAGRDTITTGPGDDTVEARGSVPALVEAGAGDDYVLQDLTAASGAAGDGGSGTDLLVLRGNDLVGDTPVALTLDLRVGTTSVDLGTGGAPATGTLGGFEEHRLIGDLGWVLHGTGGPDRFWAQNGGPMQAWTYGGDDWVVGTERDDQIDAGEGTDEVHGVAGDDTCLGVEIGEC